jgi:hypothetical protein
MRTTGAKVGWVFGAVFLMISGRWAEAAEAGPVPATTPVVEGSTSSVERLPAPVAALPGAQVTDDETPAREPTARPMAVGPGARPLRLAVDPRLIEGASFYDAVGRPDLADEYRTRHAFAVASRVVGGISLGLGAIVWAVAKTFYVDVNTTQCLVTVGMSCPQQTPTLWVPDVMMAGGLALLVVPALWTNDPVSAAEKDRLAREAGGRLSWNVSAAPAAAGRGGTFVVGGTF